MYTVYLPPLCCVMFLFLFLFLYVILMFFNFIDKNVNFDVLYCMMRWNNLENICDLLFKKKKKKKKKTLHTPSQ